MPRFLEIDLVRGIAVICMVLYHFVFDWNFFVQTIPDFHTGFWFYFARATAALFVGLAGISVTLYANRRSASEFEWKAIAKRGAFIFVLGMGISAFTLFAFPSYAIFFGILHLIGASIALSIPLLSRPRTTIILGIVFTGLGILLYQPNAQAVTPFIPVLLPVHVQSFDYVPLIPWFGVFLLGMAVGNRFYPRGQPLQGLGWQKGNALVQGLAGVGRNSLFIYLVHQPIFMGGLVLLGFVDLARIL